MAKSKPRLSVEITEEQFEKLDFYIPERMKSRLFGVVVDGLIEMFEDAEDPNQVVLFLMQRSLTTKHLLQNESG